MARLWFVLYASAAMGAGICVALQQTVNARLRFELHSPWWAGLASFSVGTLTMLAALVLSRDPRPSLALVNTTTLPSWTGGLLGATFIATGIFLVPRLGTATFLATMFVGQMLGSATFDYFGLFGLPQHPISLSRLLGLATLFVGVLLVSA